MLGIEWEKYKQSDEQKYILSNNKEILDFIEQKQKEGISFILNIEQMQQFIDEVALLFEFKYPEALIMDMLYPPNPSHCSRENCQEIAKKLNIDELTYRLHHDFNCFLDCPYGQYIDISRKKKDVTDSNKITIKIHDNGYLEGHKLNALKEQKFLINIKGINTVSDLLGKLIESPIEVDYSQLEKTVIEHKTNLQLRNMILELIPLKILYSSMPQYSYPRAASFIRMFNEKYNLYMDTKEIEDIIKEYPSVDKDIQKIKGEKF